MEFKTLKNVEIFRSGEWKGCPYTDDDLDEMVENFNTFKDSWFIPAIKPGHSEMPGQQAAGYLDNIRKKGKKLFADFVDMPMEIYNAVKQRLFDRVSIEIVPKLKREGRVYHNVVWALALLGVEVPEVSGLKPLRAFLSSDTAVLSFQTSLGISNESMTDDELKNKAKFHLEQVEKYASSLGIELAKENNMTNEKSKEITPPKVDMSAEIAELKAQNKSSEEKIAKLSADLEQSQKHSKELEDRSRQERIDRKVADLHVPSLRPFAKVFYEWSAKNETPIKFSMGGKESEALPESVVDEFVNVMNKASESILITHSKEPVFERDDGPTDEDPRSEVDKRVLDLMSKEKDLDYSAALHTVLHNDPELKKQYAQV